MTSFRKYDHLERFGRTEVTGIDVGTVYVFPKLDGTNASVWIDDNGQIQCGSRNRTLSEGADNAGFRAWVLLSEGPKATALRTFIKSNPTVTVYGEWLVPHSLKTYRDDSWRRFWIFDVYSNNAKCYMRYNVYSMLTDEQGLDVIPPLAVIDNPSVTQIDAMVASNTFQIKDGEGAGEGVVLKNYGWMNQFGRQPWAKVVRNEFKEINAKVFGPSMKHGPDHVEQKIAERYVTKALVDKVRAKVFLATVANVVTISTSGPTDEDRKELEQKNRGKIIPELLHRVFYDVVNEDLWDAIKRNSNPTIDFKKLQSFITYQVKQHAEDLF